MDRRLTDASAAHRIAGFALALFAASLLACGPPAEQDAGERTFVLESAEIGLVFDEPATLDAAGELVGPGLEATLALQPVAEDEGIRRAAFAAFDDAGNERSGIFELRVHAPDAADGAAAEDGGG
jgi:hypothetical protein